MNSDHVPKTIVNLLRETTSNVQSHLEVLTSFKDNINMYDLNSINETDIVECLNDDHFYDSQDQLYLKIVVKGIIDSLKQENNSTLDIPQNITSWFIPTTLNYDALTKKWKSKEGIVSKIDLRLNSLRNQPIIQNFAIMKLQQPRAFEDENLIHEIAVGLILNNLRDYLPCFMYTYGGIFCGYPKEYRMKANIYNDLCSNNDEAHSIVISEYIPGNLTMFEFIRDTITYSQEDKVKALILIAFSLDEANRRYKFVHGDLHSNNIMIRELLSEKSFTFPYRDDILGNKNITITTKYVPIIIDYGRTFINYEGYKLAPIKAEANNRDLKKDAGLTELWCDGKADDTGDNCLIENLVYKGANIPGFDFFRLLLSIDISQVGTEFGDIFHNCFYGRVYNQFYKPGHHWNFNLNGSITNYNKFSNQTLSRSSDIANNPNCQPTGFLGTILTDTYFTQNILTIT